MQQSTTKGWAARAVPVLVIVGSLLFTCKQLHDIGKESHFDSANVSRSLSREGGRLVSLPREVTQASEIVARHVAKDETVALSDDLAGDAFLQQRMWEALYPVRFSQEESNYIISRNPGADASDCKVVERGTHVVLARCH